MTEATFTGSGIIETAVTSAVAGGIGSFFAPASAAAVGGVWNVMGACALGGVIVSPFAGILVGITGLSAVASFANNNYGLSAILGTLTVAEMVGASLLAAEVGSALLGISAAPVFTCSLIGSAILAIPTVGLAVVALIGLAGLASALTYQSISGCDSDMSASMSMF
ncbi:MAG: hypothetical protein P1U61_07920 [Legionellaceae bacterium]|nr:hypothetical protein [Legionellaceae bacterium]